MKQLKCYEQDPERWQRSQSVGLEKKGRPQRPQARQVGQRRHVIRIRKTTIHKERFIPFSDTVCGVQSNGKWQKVSLRLFALLQASSKPLCISGTLIVHVFIFARTVPRKWIERSKSEPVPSRMISGIETCGMEIYSGTHTLRRNRRHPLRSTFTRRLASSTYRYQSYHGHTTKVSDRSGWTPIWDFGESIIRSVWHENEGLVPITSLIKFKELENKPDYDV
jgi:hypothetical protein